ncbi:MAG: hypothetical protein P4L45_09065 [Ignavibacteriaceae bacterium]|nr:hypothetical protein [Ignavibacteriaceae bacterium]
MLLNKKLLYTLFIIFPLLISCGEKKTSTTESSQKAEYENPQFVIQQAKNALGDNVKFAYKGKFNKDSIIEVSAGIELKKPKEWGIKFFLLKSDGNNLSTVYQTPLLNGSFNKCLVQKIKFPMFDYELVYYNSQGYFLGSGGGEVYSYLVNFNEGKTYYAHLVDEPGKPVSLFLSENIDINEIKSFFTSNFKRDYPSVKVVNKDIVLKY